MRLPGPGAQVLLFSALFSCTDDGPPSWAVSAGAEAPAAIAQLEGEAPYNILLITIDTLRADHLGCYGFARDTSPAIDRFAARSVRFDQALVQFPKTGPSLASLMSSTYPSTSGVNITGKTPVPEVYDLFAELLREAGYETMAVFTNPSLLPEFNFDQGFDSYEKGFGRAKRHVDLALKTLRERPRGKPFFFWIHFMDPHTPYQPPPDFEEMFKQDALYTADDSPALTRSQDMPDGRRAEEQLGSIADHAYLEGLSYLRDYVARYDAEIRCLDQHLGRLLEQLETEDLWSNTIVAMTADHGESLGEHGYYFGHGQLPFDDCVRVPLILYHPKAAPAVIRQPVALLDLAPTLLHAVGVPPGWQFEGRSLLHWLVHSGPRAAEDPRPVFTESAKVLDLSHTTFSVRKGRYKLVRFRDLKLAAFLDAGTYCLYDLQDDPGELRDVSAELPEVTRQLRDLLDAYIAEADAREPPPAQAEEVSPEVREQIRALGYTDG